MEHWNGDGCGLHDNDIEPDYKSHRKGKEQTHEDTKEDDHDG